MRGSRSKQDEAAGRSRAEAWPSPRRASAPTENKVLRRLSCRAPLPPHLVPHARQQKQARQGRREKPSGGVALATSSIGADRERSIAPLILPRSLHLVHLHNLIAIVVDHLHGDLALPGAFAFGGVEGAADGGVEGGPGGFVDLGAKGALELVVWFVAAGEVGVTDEEAFVVVVRVDESARDVVGGVRAYLLHRGAFGKRAA